MRASRFAVVALLLVAACGSDDDDAATTTSAAAVAGDADWQAVVDAANDEGSVAVYSVGTPTADAALVDAFEAAYPDIHVELTELREGDNIQRLEAEHDSGTTGADVTLNTGVNFLAEQSATDDFLVPLVGPDVEAARPNDPFDFDDKTILTVLAPFGFGWNTGAISDTLDYEDVADPQYEGRIGFIDPTSSTFATLYYKAIEDTYGEDFLRKMAAQDPQLYPSVIPMAQAAAAGEIDVAGAITRTAVSPEMPVQVGFSDSPPSAPIFGAATAFGAHPNAAQVFIDFVMSDAGQEVWAKDQVAMIDGVESAELTVDQVSIIGGVPPLATADEVQADMDRYAQIFGL